ncbi:MAG: sugar phosphate isomerase/epimerase [Candidatus Latescibacteria bacterium]|nr:sugar phosphate isomerase/epimerase [Candidatus Latescibacterota bacterium]
MRFGFNFYNWDHDLHRALDQNLDQLLTWTKETGWEGFETKAHTIQNHPERLKAACERIGIACAALGGFSDIQNMIDYAHKANVAFIRTSVPEETAQHWVTYAAERNVTLAVHPDTGHLMMCGSDPIQTLYDLGERCGFIHLKDIEMDMAKQGIKGPSFCNLGEGDLDLPGVMQALHDIHFDGWVIVERDRRVDDYLDSAQKMREVLRGMGY